MKPSFYGPIRALEYDIGTDVTPTVTFYLQEWARQGEPQPVLEPMCGTGLNLIPFLQAGVETDGLDASPHMLGVCRSKLDTLGLAATLYVQSLEEMELPRRYGFIFIPDGSFGHLHDKAVAAEALKRIHAHLLPGGWFVVDVRPPSILDIFGKPGQVDYDLYERPGDGATVFHTAVWQVEKERIIRCWNRMELWLDDRLAETEAFDYRERMYERDEMESHLRSAGFDEIRVTKGWPRWEHDAEPGPRDGMVFSCRKTAER